MFNTIAPPNSSLYPWSACRTDCNGGCDGASMDYSNAQSYHPGGVNALFADGSVKFLKNTISIFTYWALGTRAGNETCQRRQVEFRLGVRARTIPPGVAGRGPPPAPCRRPEGRRGPSIRRRTRAGRMNQIADFDPIRLENDGQGRGRAIGKFQSRTSNGVGCVGPKAGLSASYVGCHSAPSLGIPAILLAGWKNWPQIKDHIRIHLAERAIADGRLDEAKERLDLLILEHPARFWPRFLRARVAREAEETSPRAVELGLPVEEGRREFALLRAGRDFPLAERSLRRVLAEHPEDEEVRQAIRLSSGQQWSTQSESTMIEGRWTIG